MKRLIYLIIFVLVSVVAIAIPYNITHSVISPSYHLINGVNNTIPDTDYSSLVDISSELNDGSDLTTYLTNSNNTASAIYKFDEGNGSVVEDSSGYDNDGTNYGATYVASSGFNGTGLYALDFDGINDKVNISDNDQFQFGDSVTDTPFTLMAWIKIDDMTTFRIVYKYVTGKEFIWGFTGGDNILLWLQDQSTSGYLRTDSSVTYTSKQGEWLHLTSTYSGNGSDNGIKHYVNGSLIGVSYLGSGSYVAMENTGENVNIAWGGGANYGNGVIDELYVFKRELNQTEIQDIFENGLSIETNAIKPKFDLTIDTNNDYYLRLKKTSSSSAMLSIYDYQNGTYINQSNLDTDTISEGWFSTLLSNALTNGNDAEFRFFTDKPHYFSEVQLIETVNDTTPPNINSATLNNTDLNCSETVRLLSNVTDNIGVSTVYFKYNDTLVNIEQATQIGSTDEYYKDVTYTHNTGGSIEEYYFVYVNGTDVVGLENITYFSINYNYSCNQTDIINPIITLNENQTIDKALSNLTINISCTDETDLKNLSTIVYNSTQSIFNLTNISISTDLILTIFDVGDLTNIGTGVYTRNTSCFDTSNNTDFIQDFITITETIPPPPTPNATLIEIQDFNVAGTNVNIVVFVLLGLVWIALMFISILRVPILAIPTGLYGIFIGLMLITTSVGLAIAFIGVNIVIMMFIFIPRK